MFQRQKTFLLPADNKSNLETKCMREQMREEMDEKEGVGVGSGEGSENNGRVCKG